MTLFRDAGVAFKSQDTYESIEVTRQSALRSKSGSHPRLKNPESMIIRTAMTDDSPRGTKEFLVVHEEEGAE